MKKFVLSSLLLVFILSANAQKKRSATQSRSAKTGQYVTKSYADKHKATTYTTTRKKKN